MTELLSKEKQFLKLNEQLDRLTSASAEHESSSTNDKRFLTYEKAKGPSTLLKKQGAGDGILNVVDFNNSAITNVKEQQRTGTVMSNRPAGGETYRSSNHYTNELPSSSPQYRTNSKATKSPVDPTRSQTYTRPNKDRVAQPLYNNTFTIKYRNPKFLESPSLEVLVKEESSSMRCQRDNVSNIGSINSMAIEDGISTGRRSQTSSHTVPSKKIISSEGLIKFLKSKIVILEEDHERLSQDLKKQKELLEQALEHTKTIEQQRDQAYNKNKTLNEQLTKNEKQLEEANRRLKERNLEQSVQQKEFEATKRELKLLTQTNANLEKRLFRANEDLENTRKSLNEMKNNERDHKVILSQETEVKDKQIKGLKKQRADLLNAYKKQLFLIDNLKRQNVCLEQAKMLDFSEKEFAKILDWHEKK